MKVIELKIEESKVNKNCFMLIATAQNGTEYVCGGDGYDGRYLFTKEQSFDFQVREEKKV